jgi:cytochrome c biogenesis protein CcdA/thiol-disulfide isomerase/thioredoxin
MNWGLELLAIIAGLLTVASPCILPILPPLLSASVATPLRHRPFWIVLGLAGGFTLFGTTFTLFGSFLGLSNTVLRQAALAFLFFFSLSLIWPKLWEGIGTRISLFAQRLMGRGRPAAEQGRLHALLLGGSLGLVWAPCAGPILGIVLTLATVQPSFARTLLLMGGYSLGAAAPMLLIGYGGRRIAGRLQRFRSWGPISHKALGFLTLATVIALFFNLDTLLLARLPGGLFITNRIETVLVGKKEAGAAPQGRPDETAAAPGVALAAIGAPTSVDAAPLPVMGPMPEFAGITAWINSPPLSAADLRGKVVLVDFWTYSCINCIRTLPYVTRWFGKYKDEGFVVVGVHTPEFSFEQELGNVEQAVVRNHIHYPVALDNGYGTWNAFKNHYWPAHYLIDAQGQIRETHFGEGQYEETERAIQALLAEAKLLHQPVGLDSARKPVDFSKIRSDETYIGYARAERFTSPQPMRHDTAENYSAPTALSPDEWALEGTWRISSEAARLEAPGGSIRFRFEAPKLNLVMAGGEDGTKAVTGRVYLDGKPVSPRLRGADVQSDGTVMIGASRLYNLVALSPSDDAPHLFELRFDRPEVELFAFTFG